MSYLGKLRTIWTRPSRKSGIWLPSPEETLCIQQNRDEVTDEEIIRAIRGVPCHFAPPLIASTYAPSTDSANVTTSGINTTGANLLIGVESVGVVGGGTFSDLVGGNSNSYSLTGNFAFASGEIAIYWCYAPAHVGSGHTASVTSATFPALGFAAFNLAVTPGLDQNAANGAGGASTQQAGSITPGFVNEIIICALNFNAPATSASIDSGMILLGVQANNGHCYGLAFAYLQYPSTVAINPTWTVTGGVSELNAGIASFKATAPVTGGLFRPAPMTGMGAGGPFFASPLS